jgi:GNAT superfamily N-acetyltransferase
MTALAIRQAVPDDAETLYSIHRESVLRAYVQIFPPDRYAFPDEEMRAHWAESVGGEDRVGLIAERSGRPVGFVTVSPGWLRNLFVLPAEWGRGAGTALHDDALALLRDYGEGARLWVLEQNERARRFYEVRGWRHDGERASSEFPPYPPVLRYALALGEAPDPSRTPTHPGDELGG